MRLTVRHMYDFGDDRALVGDDLVRPEAWDALRVGTSGPFSLPATREAWEEQADARPELRDRAARVGAIADDLGAATIASYGVGAALLELWMRRHSPHRRITLTDYGSETVARLRSLAGDDFSVSPFDLLADAPLGAELHLFHRIDTELTNAQWRLVTERFAGVRVLIVATEIIDVRRALTELAGRVRRPGRTKAGWMRTRPAFEALWARAHDVRPVQVADLDGWILEPRR